MNRIEIRHSLIERPARLAAALLVLCLTAPASAQFTTVLNIPPNIAPNSIGSNTQLNLFNGGTIGNNFNAGASNGLSEDAEVNVFGGTIGYGYDAYGGNVTNIFGGNFGENLSVHAGGVANIAGGSIGPIANAFNGSIVNISAGNIGQRFDAHDGSLVNISGGAIADGFEALIGTARFASSEMSFA